MENIWNYDKYERTLQQETNFLQYLRLLKKKIKDYAVFISVRDTGTGTQVTQKLCDEFFNLLGLKKNIFANVRFSYAAAISKGKVVAEVLPRSPLQAAVVEGNIKDLSYHVYSGGFDCREDLGQGSRIIINGKNYSRNERGLNIVVVDLNKNEVIDSGIFDMYDGARTAKMYAHLSQLNDFLSAHPGVAFFTFGLPRMRPFTDVATENEKFIYSNALNQPRFLENAQEIWDKQLSPLCSEFSNFEDFRQVVDTPKSYINHIGIRTFEDLSTNTVNTSGGIRVTTNQPTDYKRAIFIVGECTTFGVGAKDKYTIASCLQRRLNKDASDMKFVVFNYGFFLGGVETQVIKEMTDIICSLPVKDGDIIIQTSFGGYPYLPHCDLMRQALNNYDYGELFYAKDHYTKNGNQMTADGLFEFLRENNYFPVDNNIGKTTPPVSKIKSVSENASLSTKEEDELSKYKRQLFDFYETRILPKVGAIVMNCNPFTLGHRYLVEEALKKCDRLIVFVVEEDKSQFSFTDRINLVRENLSDLPQVMALPSGKFVLSSRTFEEYFNKESLQERVIDTSLDVTVFAKEIAPCMNIKIRFVGEEPNDNVTKQYNETMKRILPQYGIELTEIPRLQKNNAPISASVVRQKLEQNDFEGIKELVPTKTFEYLENWRR